MSLGPFVFSGLPRLHFGAGSVAQLPALAERFGSRVLFVSGGASLDGNGRRASLVSAWRAAGLEVHEACVAGEPSPDFVDETVRACRGRGIDVVIAVGGGSVMDAGKAVSAMLPHGHSVVEHLEGLPGSRPHDGIKVPFIAVPTTAGTGSEASKNAVLSRIGPGGFKRSIRHDNLVPDVAVLDPELTLACPPAVTAACGADAFTQLLEGFVSPRSSPLTDALARDGMERIASALLAVHGPAAHDIEARGAMLYGAFLSGVVLAQAGLGIVHGLAGPIGARYAAPHGAVCGTLLAPAVAANIAALEAREPSSPALAKYARVGRMMAESGQVVPSNDPLGDLVRTLESWSERLLLPRLSSFGLDAAAADELAARPDMKQNPVSLTSGEVKAVLHARL